MKEIRCQKSESKEEFIPQNLTSDLRIPNSNFSLFLIILAMVFIFGSCSSQSVEDTKSSGLENKEFVIERSPDIEKVKPHRPVKIKVKRDLQGRYSWELSGEDIDEIIKIDRRLKRAFSPAPEEKNK